MSASCAPPSERTIIQRKIGHFRRLLDTPLDTIARKTVGQMITEMEADLEVAEHGLTPERR